MFSLFIFQPIDCSCSVWTSIGQDIKHESGAQHSDQDEDHG